jgi:hypothetical protein
VLQNAWFIPLFIHILLTSLCFYLQYNSDTPNCEVSLKLWLFSRACFSLFIAGNILFFILKISWEFKRENSFFERAKKIYPNAEEAISQFDFWIRRKSLVSTPGILLLISGVISLFWSYIIINLYYLQNKFAACDQKVLALLNFNSILIFIGNVPIIVVFFSVLIVKLVSFICAFFCPRVLVKVSKTCRPKKIISQVVKYKSLLV